MDQKDEVKSKVDIVELISSYIPLKRAGRNFSGLCPFHGEKTPSFMVSAERQVFKCFGCGEGGDAFTFLEKMEGWDFREALEELAKKVGVKLTSFAPSGKTREREKLIEINKLVSKFYSYLLNEHKAGERARKYLKDRGISQETWKKFNVGYAPEAWENTFEFLTKRKFEVSDIANSGLVISRNSSNGSFYDRFRNRLIFPLFDDRGNVLGFSGRVIDDEVRSKNLEIRTEKLEARKEPKYLNSPETPIFNKGSLLFGLNVTKSAIRDKNETLLVEGEFDVMSAYQVGIQNVVASKGTALTDKQIALIARLCAGVSLCFDGDIAGDAAMRRGIELLDVSGVNVKVVFLGSYKDPDEFCQKDPTGFKKAIVSSLNIYDFFIDSAINRHNPQTAEGKKKIGQEILPILAKITDDLMRAHYIDKLAKNLNLDSSLIESAVEKRSKGQANVNLDAAADFTNLATSKVNMEEYFLALFLEQEKVEHEFYNLLLPSDFASEDAGSFWKWLRDIIGDSKNASLKKVISTLPSNFSQFVDNLYLINTGPSFSDKEIWAAEILKVSARIRESSLKKKLSDISKNIKMAENTQDTNEVSKLTKKFDTLSKELRKGDLNAS
jgi:DNA primase